MIDDVVPDSRQVFHQLTLARLCIEVCYSRIEVVGAYGMPHRLVLVAELVAILVVVLTICHRVTDGNQPLGQRQVFLVTRLTIHLSSTHIVTGTDGITRELGSIVGQEVVEEVGSLFTTLE